VGACLERRLGLVEAGLQRVEVTRHHLRPAGQDAKHRTPADDGVRQCPDPREQEAVLPRATKLRQRFLHQVGGTSEVLTNEGVPDCVSDEAA
jgi:hypothetical protein